MRLFAPFALIAAALLALAACGGGDGGSGATSTPFTLIGSLDDANPTALAETAEPGGGAPDAPDAATGQLVSLGWLVGDAAYPTVSAPLAGQSPDQGLRNAIEDALDGREGEFSVIVHNLDDGRYAAIDPNATYYAASLFKAAVLLEAYRQRDAGLVGFETELMVDEEAFSYDLGTLEYLEIKEGDSVTLGDAVAAMIIASDTALANLVLQEVGYASVDATLDSIGARTMSVSTTSLPTTAADMYALFAAIVTGDGVSESSRREMLNLLAQEWFGSGIIAGVPGGTPLVHKTGSYTDATHDAAVVEGPAGPYFIAVLSDRSFEWEPIAEVSAAVWQYFATNP